MTQTEIRFLEKELWATADNLRSNSTLTAAEYKDPLLGLVLLRFAQNRYEDAKEEIERKLPINPRTGKKRLPNKSDFAAEGVILLPETAEYDHLANLPEGADTATAINEAMKSIEAEYPDLEGILPKNYHDFSEKLLQDLLRTFNSDAVKKAKGDVFGRIYEFFLMKFSMQGAGAQEGGEFFTPPSLVTLIVEFIQPNQGTIHDPACGSGGMFVQSAHFVKTHANRQVNEAIKVYGTEYKSNTTRLAKMNLAIHGIEGTILNENSFYSDPHDLLGKCDFVMANPPFNVDKVDAKNKFLTQDKRLPFGVPKTGKGSIKNANYLWIQYFYSYLNATGRAGFVMASSATDAGHAEKLVRKQLIESGAIECIVAIGNNFFYTRSLPCHVWFLNKGKAAENRDKILMIDARKTFRVIHSTLNDFSKGQQQNLIAILESFRQDAQAIANAHTYHQNYCQKNLEKLRQIHAATRASLQSLIETEKWQNIKIDALPPMIPETISLENVAATYLQYQNSFSSLQSYIERLKNPIEPSESTKKSKSKKLILTAVNKLFKNKANQLQKPLKSLQKETEEIRKNIEQGILDWQALAEYFPNQSYQDVEGLCKVVDLAEIQEQDYSLTPGRYVGVKIEIDMDFDYQGRMKEIHAELAKLNKEANGLMNKIQSFEI